MGKHERKAKAMKATTEQNRKWPNPGEKPERKQTHRRKRSINGGNATTLPDKHHHRRKAQKKQPRRETKPKPPTMGSKKKEIYQPPRNTGEELNGKPTLPERNCLHGNRHYKMGRVVTQRNIHYFPVGKHESPDSSFLNREFIFNSSLVQKMHALTHANNPSTQKTKKERGKGGGPENSLRKRSKAGGENCGGDIQKKEETRGDSRPKWR